MTLLVLLCFVLEQADASNEDGVSKTRPIIEFPAENTTQNSDSENVSISIEEQPKALLASEATVASNALVPTGVLAGSGGSWGVSAAGPYDGKSRRGSAPESAGDMFARWESEGVDAENVVRDALRAGRVPLAVVQLHRIRSREFLSGGQDQRPQMIDVFQDVQEIGRGIVYELLCKVSKCFLVVQEHMEVYCFFCGVLYSMEHQLLTENLS